MSLEEEYANQGNQKLGTVVSRPSDLIPPTPDPSDDPEAPRFAEWPAERSFTEVVMDKTMDTLVVCQMTSSRRLLERQTCACFKS